MITPVEIENIKFKKSFMGYNLEEVEDFLNKMIDSFEALYQENLDYKEKIEALNATISQYKTMEDTLRETLVLAQSTGEDVKQAAEERAKLIVAEGEAKAAKLVEQANEELQRIGFKKEETKRSFLQFKAQAEGMLQTQLKFLEDMSLELGQTFREE